MKIQNINIKIFFCAIAFVMFFCLAEKSEAAPVISNVNGTIVDESSITISGSGFGIKTPAEPILWETFEDGTDGTYLATDPDWPSYLGSANTGGKYSSTSPHSGGLCIYNYVAHDFTGTAFATNNYFFEESDQIYYSYMYRHEGTPVGPAVQKNGRINSTGNRYNGDGVVALSDSYVYYDDGDTSFFPSADEGTGRYFSEDNLGSSAWTRHQIYGKYSDPSGDANGFIQVSVGSEEKTFANIVTRAAGYSFRFNNVILGLMFSNLEGYPDTYHHIYIDDVYIDNTRARVEMCEGSLWSNRGACNPQIPSAWSDGSISATVNGSQITDGSIVYAYVIDSSGVVNSSGFPIVFGNSGEEDTTPPASPSGLNIS